jgi:hypothetical protein
MTSIYLFVKDKTDADLLKRILSTETLEGVEFVVAERTGRIPSLARTYLVQRRTAVAVVMDSDTLEPNLIEERQQEVEELIRMVAGNLPVKVLMAVPEVDAWFFAVPGVIERVLGVGVPAEWVPFGTRDPKGVLKELSTRAGTPWNRQRAIDALEETDIEQLRKLPLIQELCEFLPSTRLHQPAAV